MLISGPKIFLGIFLALSLAACGHHPPRDPPTVYKPSASPVSVSCVPADLEPAPTIQTAAEIRALPNPETRMQAAYIALAQREQRARLVEPVIADCR